MLKNNLIYYKKAFTLIELMLAMLIISSVLMIGFESYTRVWFGKINLMEQTNIEKNNFFFSEKLFEIIKRGGSIDYEEYFNRMVVGTGSKDGHYDNPTGFGNFGAGGSIGSENYGKGFYYCRSVENGKMLKDIDPSENSKFINEGCYNNNLYINSATGTTNEPNVTHNHEYQRYGQYSFQFIDYNGDASSDYGDSNSDSEGNIIGDDDDEFLGLGPVVFEAGSDVRELYLISGDKKSRTLIRWNVTPDDDRPEGKECAMGVKKDDDDITNKEYCIGTIEFLKLEGVDQGMDHILGEPIDTDGTQYDGVIDTWLIDKDFDKGSSDRVVAGSKDENNPDYYYRIPLFPTSINVTDFQVFVYPNIDYKNAWKEESDNISPYIILKYSVKPSWEMRKKIKSEGKEIDISTTINLTEIFSK